MVIPPQAVLLPFLPQAWIIKVEKENKLPANECTGVFLPGPCTQLPPETLFEF